MSLPEILLWQVLRGRPAGLKFRRQHPTGPYDLDFYCNDARLAIEVDGQAHERGDRPERDAARDRWLGEKGIETMRIPAAEVLADLEAVIRGVIAEAIGRLPSSSPSSPRGGGPPPTGGGGGASSSGGDGPSTGFAGPPPPDELGEESS
jgi:very-short-patch-repair endonuclease